MKTNFFISLMAVIFCLGLTGGGQPSCSDYNNDVQMSPPFELILYPGDLNREVLSFSFDKDVDLDGYTIWTETLPAEIDTELRGTLIVDGGILHEDFPLDQPFSSENNISIPAGKQVQILANIPGEIHSGDNFRVKMSFTPDNAQSVILFDGVLVSQDNPVIGEWITLEQLLLHVENLSPESRDICGNGFYENLVFRFSAPRDFTIHWMEIYTNDSAIESIYLYTAEDFISMSRDPEFGYSYFPFEDNEITTNNVEFHANMGIPYGTPVGTALRLEYGGAWIEWVSNNTNLEMDTPAYEIDGNYFLITECNF